MAAVTLVIGADVAEAQLEGARRMLPARPPSETNPVAPARAADDRSNRDIVDAWGEPVDASTYRVGPGDDLMLVVSGVTDTWPMRIDPEGGLLLPGSAGRVVIAGETLADVRRLLRQPLRREFRDRPFELILRSPRRFKVYVGGEVADPGSYVASAVTRVSEIIERAGGVRRGASERRVRILRAGGEVLEADLVGFAQTGDRERNPTLAGGDIVQVPVAESFFSLWGAVQQPGRFELRPGDTFADALALAGGAGIGARLDRVELRRVDGSDLGPPRIFDLEAPDAARAASVEFGDAWFVPRAFEPDRLTATVEVTGEVAAPGRYPIQPGRDTVQDLVERAGGFTEDAHRPGVRLLRVPTTPGGEEAAERLAESTLTSLKPIEAEIYRLEERSWPRAVHIVGADAAAPTLLADRDLLVVPRLSGSVLVDGRVTRPGYVPWRSEWRLQDYVEAAGGFDIGADRGRLLVQRFGSPGHLEEAEPGDRLEDGDRIWIAEKPPTDRWKLTREVVQFLAQIATVVIIIDQATQ